MPKFIVIYIFGGYDTSSGAETMPMMMAISPSTQYIGAYNRATLASMSTQICAWSGTTFSWYTTFSETAQFNQTQKYYYVAIG